MVIRLDVGHMQGRYRLRRGLAKRRVPLGINPGQHAARRQVAWAVQPPRHLGGDLPPDDLEGPLRQRRTQFVGGQQLHAALQVRYRHLDTEIGAGRFVGTDIVQGLLEGQTAHAGGTEGEQLVQHLVHTLLALGRFHHRAVADLAVDADRLADGLRLYDQLQAIRQCVHCRLGRRGGHLQAVDRLLGPCRQFHAMLRRLAEGFLAAESPRGYGLA